jgi:hypothetical protein
MWLSGNTAARFCSQEGASAIGENTPERIIIGRAITLTIGIAVSAFGTIAPSAIPRAQKEVAPITKVTRAAGSRLGYTCTPKARTPTAKSTTAATNASVSRSTILAAT